MTECDAHFIVHCVCLCAAGVKKGDRIAIYMPMVVELVVAMLACARIGAVHSIVVRREWEAHIYGSVRMGNDVEMRCDSLQVSLLNRCVTGLWTRSVHCSSLQVTSHAFFSVPA